MTSLTLAAVCVVFLGLTFVAWRRYLWWPVKVGLSSRIPARTAAIAARRIVVARYAVSIHSLQLRFPPSEYTRNLLPCKDSPHP